MAEDGSARENPAPMADDAERSTQAPTHTDDDSRIASLRRLLDRAESAGPSSLDEADLLELFRLYRFASSLLARIRTRGGKSPAADERIRAVVARAHALVHVLPEKRRGGFVERAIGFLLDEVPRAIRGEWKVVAASFVLVYGLAIASFVAVRRDLGVAYSLMSPEAVSQEIGQLEDTQHGESFRGNFTFGLGQSPLTAGWIMTHNMSVGILFFGSGLIPPLFVVLLGVNGLMLGTYTAVAAHWGQALSISSILWCHGVLEIEALVLAGAAGLVLVRAWIAPGPWSRRHAMQLESAKAWRLLAPVFPMLFCAGMIEGFVSPHAPTAARVGVAAISAIALTVWIGFGGRAGRAPIPS
jgi:uncharacterized membrane protein SpoIIM required for sporulation